jgi:uncharacterized heparinase superfamily protein
MRAARALFYRSALYHLSLWGPTPRALALRLPEPWPGDAAAGERLLAGEFRFLEESVESRLPPWTAERPEAWRAELHRFAWLADLAAVGSDGAWQAARLWTMDWLRRCEVYDSVGWRADVTGDRLFHWLEHAGPLVQDAALGRALLRGVARQLRHLDRCVLHEQDGVARLRALRGLVAAAAAVQDRRRLARAEQRLARTAEAQILPDGGHAARSPRAQLRALACLIDARAALHAAQREVPGALIQAIDRAAPILRFFRHGDGGFAQFNGADEGDAAAIDRVLARADAKGRAPLSAPHVGFQRLQAGRSYVLIDCGKPPPAGFDEEAHAGTLSFEMSHGRERLIVNCGAYRGPDAQWRQASRATAAHSTLTVADTNSSELRPDGTLRNGPAMVSCERAEDHGSQWVAATHDGYARSFGLTHARQLFLAADGDDLRGEDRLTGRPGQAFAIRFHLHPQVQASLTQDGNAVLLRLPSGAGWRLRAEGAVMSLGESVYLAGGGMRKTQQVVLDGHVGTHGAEVRWAVRREGRKQSAGGAVQEMLEE